MRKNHSILLRFMASAALAAVLLTSCAGGAATYEKQMELGRKYLTEMNYAEAIAAFTEAIKLNPDDIEAYMARAEAYAALEKYNEATADYTTVIEKTDDQPYLQATAYIGRAGVSESAAALTDAESDYAAALAQLEKDTDEQDADAVLTLKKDVLVKHAAVCITLALLEKAADDYDALEALGENVTAKRNELADLVKDTTGADTDAENNLTPDTTDTTDAETPETKDAEETDTKDAPDSKETAADSKQEQAASSKEEAASSREEQPASSKEEAASSKQETQSAQQTGQKETYKVNNPNWSEESATVSYQTGANTVHVRVMWDEPDAHSVWEYTYTLSQPLTSAEHPSKGSTVFHVPAGTTVTCKSSYTGPNADILGIGESNLFAWMPVSSASTVKYGESDTEPVWGTSLTVQSGAVYAVAYQSDADYTTFYIAFPAIGFMAD